MNDAGPRHLRLPLTRWRALLLAWATLACAAGARRNSDRVRRVEAMLASRQNQGLRLPSWTLHAVLSLAFVSVAKPMMGQSLADSVQLITLAVQGIHSPNGPLTEIDRNVGCLAIEKVFCRWPDPMVDHAPPLLSAVSAVLNVPVAADSVTLAPECPWYSDLPATRRGVRLTVGRLQFLGDSATIFVGRSCRGLRRGFSEGSMAVLRRVNGAWSFAGVPSSFIE